MQATLSEVQGPAPHAKTQAKTTSTWQPCWACAGLPGMRDMNSLWGCQLLQRWGTMCRQEGSNPRCTDCCTPQGLPMPAVRS